MRQTFIETCGFICHTTGSKKDQGVNEECSTSLTERRMFNFPDFLLVGMLLQRLMFVITGTQAGLLWRGNMRLKVRTSKYVLLNQPPQKPLATMSRYAPS